MRESLGIQRTKRAEEQKNTNQVHTLLSVFTEKKITRIFMKVKAHLVPILSFEITTENPKMICNMLQFK